MDLYHPPYPTRAIPSACKSVTRKGTRGRRKSREIAENKVSFEGARKKVVHRRGVEKHDAFCSAVFDPQCTLDERHLPW